MRGLRDDANELEMRLSQDEKEEDKRLRKKIRRAHRDADDLAQRQLTLLETSLRGLERLGHVEDGKLTEKGNWAAELCTSLVLELAEALDEHLLSELGLEELVGVVASIAGDLTEHIFRFGRILLRKSTIE